MFEYLPDFKHFSEWRVSFNTHAGLTRLNIINFLESTFLMFLKGLRNDSIARTCIHVESERAL